MSLDNSAIADLAWTTPAQSDDLVGGSSVFWGVKRVFDISVSLLLLPVMLFFALLLLVLNPFQNRGPLVFRQKRMGRDGKPFLAIKFRSMLPADEITRGANDPIETHRITALGQVIRKTRIDELPQVINVLRGEMSLIGPRPDAYDHAQEYLEAIPEYRARHTVRPGISGLAQVTLGYAEGIDATRAKAISDIAYIRNAGVLMDMRIIWLTLVTIIMRRGY